MDSRLPFVSRRRVNDGPYDASMNAFDDAMTSRPGPDGSRIVTIDDAWDTPNQTRNGGYVLANVVAAMRHHSPKPDVLSASVNFLKPHPVGEAPVHTELVRGGRRTATLLARLVDDDQVTTTVSATFTDRTATAPGYTHASPTAPSIPPPADCIDPFETVPRGIVKIADHFDYRHAALPGWIQGSPSGTTEATYWTRFADGRDPDDLALLLVPDAYPPVVAEIDKIASATVQMTVHVYRDPAPGWLLAHVSTRHVIDGFHDEDVELWDSAGNLVAQSRQLAVLLS